MKRACLSKWKSRSKVKVTLGMVNKLTKWTLDHPFKRRETPTYYSLHILLQFILDKVNVRCNQIIIPYSLFYFLLILAGQCRICRSLKVDFATMALKRIAKKIFSFDKTFCRSRTYPDWRLQIFRLRWRQPSGRGSTRPGTATWCQFI